MKLPRYTDAELVRFFRFCEVATTCEGPCREHQGDLQVVRVTRPGHQVSDFGFHKFCQEAIRMEQDHGYTITPVTRETLAEHLSQ